MDPRLRIMYVKRALRTKDYVYLLCTLFLKTQKQLLFFSFPDCILLTTYNLH